MRNSLMIAVLLLACPLAQAESTEEIYNKACHICHATGVANAPKVHDVDAWKPRLDKGMDALVSSIKNGFNAMPPGGMCPDCTDEQYKALIKFMSSPKSE